MKLNSMPSSMCVRLCAHNIQSADNKIINKRFSGLHRMEQTESGERESKEVIRNGDNTFIINQKINIFA